MGRVLVQDCKILPVFPPVFPSQARWPLSQENASLMSGRCDSGAWMSEGGFNALFLPSWDHHLLPQGFPLGSDSWGISWDHLDPKCISCVGGCQEDGKETCQGLPWALGSLLRGDILLPKPGKCHQCWIHFSYLYKSVSKTHDRERLCTTQSISRLAEGVHRGTHTLTCYIIRQAVQCYFFIAILPPTPSLCLMPWERQLPSSLSSKNTYRLRKHFTRRAVSDV